MPRPLPARAVALALVSLLGGAHPRAEAGDPWRYVLPPAGDAFEHPPIRALATSTTRPGDLAEAVSYRGGRRRYAQIRYGSPNSARVAVVLDEAGPGDADLYVDADRDRRIEAGEKAIPAVGDRRAWRVPLEPAGGPGESSLPGDDPRSVVFRLGATGLTLGHAALGYMEGRVEVGGRAHAARRVDVDGNGRLADPQDLLWVDLDDDGRWDPATERLPFAPVLAVAGARHAARSDPAGRRLALAPLEGTGTIRLAPARPTAAGSVVEMTALMVGRDGSAVGLAGGGAVVVPVGDYRLAAATVGVRDPAGSTWTFTFSDVGRRGEPAWHPVAKDERRVVDPVGELDLRTGLGADETPEPGGHLEVQPRLYNGDGLLIVSAGRSSAGAGGEGPTAEVAYRDGDGPALASARCGFL